MHMCIWAIKFIFNDNYLDILAGNQMIYMLYILLLEQTVVWLAQPRCNQFDH